MSKDQHRIYVETGSDWQNIRNNYTQAVISKLEERTKDESEREVLRAHLNQFIDRTFAFAQPNLRVNGRDFDSLDETEEAFDEALDRRVWSLADHRLSWHKSISESRRKTPIAIQHSFEQFLKHAYDVDDVESERLRTDKLAAEEPEPDDPSEFLDRYSFITEGFHKTSAIGEELKQSISSQQERSERYETVEGDVKTLKP